MSWNAYGQTFNAPPTSGPTGPQFSSHGSHDGEEVPSNAFDRINLHERNDTNGIVNSEQMRSTRRNLAGPSHQHSFPLPATMIEAIPSPQPKVHYEAPVFRTFQERKRANDTSALGDGPSKPRPTPDPSTLAMMGHAAQALPKASTPPVANGRSQVTNHVSAPSWPQAVHPPPRAGPSRPLPRPSQPSPFPVVNRPPPPPLQASLERSDTISSIKSLDRMGFATPGKRPLPQTPVMVNSSKSLDRGTPSRLGPGGKRDWSRKQPSVVSEEDTDGSETSSPVFPIQLLSPAPPTIIFPPTINTPPVIVEPEDEKASSPAKSIQLPTINLPDSDPVEETTTVSETTSGVAFSGLPVIAVSSEETPPMEPEAKSSPLNGAILCAGCCNPIIGRIVNAMSQRWHPRCFKCDQCGELLEHVSSYEWDGKAYCHLDYHDKFAYRCFHCKTPIVDARFVTLDDPILGQRYYHELHFFCSECGDPFLDPSKSSAPGTERNQDEEGETNPFVIQKGHPYCERCHLRLHKPKCKKCSNPIPDVAINAMGAIWHKECFTCTACGDDFANNLFFPKDGKALCTSCWEVTV